MHTFEATFKSDFFGLTTQIRRIQRDNNIFKEYKSIPIQNSAFWEVATRFKADQESECFLPRLYAALTYLTGPSDNSYDDYKGSYSFTFELTVKKK